MKAIKTHYLIWELIGLLELLGLCGAFYVLPAERRFLVLPVPFLINMGCLFLYFMRNDHKRPEISRGNTLCGYGIVAFLWILAVMFVGFLFVPVQ